MKNRKKLRKLRKMFGKIDICVMRRTKTGVGMSKPCVDCLNTMKELGVNKVYYTEDTGDVVGQRVATMTDCYTTQMVKHMRRNKYLLN